MFSIYCLGKTQWILAISWRYLIKPIKLLSSWDLVNQFLKKQYWTIFFTWSYSASCLSQRTPTPPPSKTKKVEDYSKLQHHLYLACRNTVHNRVKIFMKLQLFIFAYYLPKISCNTYDRMISWEIFCEIQGIMGELCYNFIKVLTPLCGGCE